MFVDFGISVSTAKFKTLVAVRIEDSQRLILAWADVALGVRITTAVRSCSIDLGVRKGSRT